MVRRYLFTIGSAILLLGLVAAGPVFAQSAGQPAAEEGQGVQSRESQKITLEIRDTPIKKVLEMLFKGAGVSYVLDPALDKPPYDKITVSMSLQDVTFEEALKTLVKAHGLTYRIEGGGRTHMISPRKPQPDSEGPPVPPGSASQAVPAQGAKPGSITIEFRDTPVKIAIDSIFRGTGASYAIDRSVDTSAIISSLSLKDIPFEQALTAVTRVAGLVYVVDRGVYLIKRKPANADADPPAAATAEDDRRVLEHATVRISIPPMPIKSAVWAVMTKGAAPAAWAKADDAWVFKNNLGNAVMQGAKFYNFPRGKAAALMLMSCGLIPPYGDGRVVSARGLSSFTDAILGSGGYGFRTATLSDGTWCTTDGGREDSPAMSIAAIRSNGTWYYTILANNATCKDLLNSLLATAGVGYIMPQRTNWPQMQVMVRFDRMTLDQALDSFMRMFNMSYRKTGTPDRPTYVLSDWGAGLPPAVPVR